MAFLATVTMVAALLAIPVATLSATDLHLQSFYGHDGAVAPNRWNPLTLRITNRGAPFSGEIVVKALIDTAAGGVETAYVVGHPLRLGSDRSATIRLVIPAGRTALPVAVRARGSAGDDGSVHQWRVEPPWDGGPFVVAISDHVAVDTSSARIAYPLIETLPDHPAGYDAAEALLIGDPDLARADGAQVEAIRVRLERPTSLRLPVVARGLQETTVSRVLFSDPIYRYPPRWIVTLALLAYLATVATVARVAPRWTIGAVPLLFALVIGASFGLVDTPPASAMAEVQRVRAIAGESGAVAKREVRVMSVDAREISIRVPRYAVAVPESGRTLRVEAGPTGDIVRERVDPWSAGVVTFVEVASNPLGIEVTPDAITVENVSSHRLRDVAVVGRSGIAPIGELEPGQVRSTAAGEPTIGATAQALYRELRRDESMPAEAIVALGDALLPPVIGAETVDRTVHRAVVIVDLDGGVGP